MRLIYLLYNSACLHGVNPTTRIIQRLRYWDDSVQKLSVVIVWFFWLRNFSCPGF